MMRLPTILLVLAGSALSALGVLYSFLWPLAPLGLGLFLFTLWFHIRTPGGAFIAGLAFGVSTAGAAIAWSWNAIPLSWAHLDMDTSVLAMGLVWLVVSLSIGLMIALASPVLAHVKRAPAVLLPILTGVLWVLAEFAGMWAFAVLTFGPGSLFGPHFSVASLGYPLAESPFLLWLMGGGGIAGLAFLAGALGAIVATFLARPRAQTTYTAAFLALAACALLHAAFADGHSSVPHLTIALLTADTPMEGDQNVFPLYAAMFEHMASAQEHPDIIAIPEGSDFKQVFDSTDMSAAALARVNPDALVISSTYTAGDNGVGVREVLSYETASTTLATYEKQMLMPLGEYAPDVAYPLLSLLKNPWVKQYLSQLTVYPKPDEPLEPVSFAGARIGALMCSEILSPLLYHQLGEQGANVLVDIAHPSWFRDSSLLLDKTLELAKVHAVANHAFFLAAENGAPSFAIDPEGRVRQITPIHQAGILFVSLPSGETRFEPLTAQASTTP